MFNQSEFEIVKNTYTKLIAERSAKSRKIWSIILFVFIALMIGIALIPDFFENEVGLLAYLIYVGVIFVGLIIALLISIYGISEKPTFNYLYKEIIQKINFSEGTFYNYTEYEKQKWDFNVNGGLFSRHARIDVKRHLSGISPSENSFDIFDATMITGSGKNQTVHFKGFYFISKQTNNNYFQVRSHSKPSRKAIDFQRVEEIEEVKVYIEEGKSLSNVEHEYIDLVKKLRISFSAKKIYLSLTKDELHFAYTPTKNIRKYKNLSLDKINELYNSFVSEINLIDELSDINSF